MIFADPKDRLLVYRTVILFMELFHKGLFNVESVENSAHTVLNSEEPPTKTPFAGAVIAEDRVTVNWTEFPDGNRLLVVKSQHHSEQGYLAYDPAGHYLTWANGVPLAGRYARLNDAAYQLESHLRIRHQKITGLS